MINIIIYLAALPGTKASSKVGETELNKTILNIIPNGCSNQAYVHGFDCESITFKNQSICLNAWILWDLFMKVLYNLHTKIYQSRW